MLDRLQAGEVMASEGEVSRTRWIRRVLAAVAALFGIATIVAGTRVLLGADPGYAVFRPLLIYNTVMGVAYLAAGVAALRSSRHGMVAAAAIFLLNGLVLGIIGALHAAGQAIALESVGAMVFRTGVWLVLAVGFAWLHHRHGPAREVRQGGR